MEITIDIALGLALILIELLTEIEFGVVFGYLIGVYLMLRGSVHFFGVSLHEEKSDIPLYLFHIAALIVGSYVFFSGNFTPAILIHLILGFSIITGGYLTYSGYKGYKSYRYQKTLYMPESDQPAQDTRVEKRVPTSPQPEAEKEVPVQDHIS